MKKSACILAAVLIAVCATGCGSKDKTASGGTAGKTSDAASQTAKLDIDSLSKYVELCSYQNIDLDWNNTSNTEYLNQALQSYNPQKTEIKNRGIKNGDVANIDYTGYKDGKEFSGGSATGYDLKIGSHSFINGFEEGLIGVKAGETKNLNLTFPESYGTKELAGQAVVFRVKVNSIYTEKYSDSDTLSAKNSVFGTALLNAVVEGSTYTELPGSALEYYKNRLNTMYTNYAISQGYDSLEKYLTANGATTDSFSQTVNKTAQSQLKNDIAMVAIAKKEKLMPTEKEYTDALNSYAAANSCTAKELEDKNGREVIELSVLAEKVEGFLKTQSEIR